MCMINVIYMLKRLRKFDPKRFGWAMMSSDLCLLSYEQEAISTCYARLIKQSELLLTFTNTTCIVV